MPKEVTKNIKLSLSFFIEQKIPKKSKELLLELVRQFSCI